MFKYIDSAGQLIVKNVVSHVVIGFVALIVLLGSFVVVGAGERGVLLQLGKVKGVYDNGFHFKLPFIQSVEKLTVQTQKEQVEATAASQDLQNVTTVVAVNYNLKPESVGMLWQNIGEDYKTRVLDPAIQETIKASTANYTAEQLVTKREQARAEIEALLKEKMKSQYIEVTSISIVNFKFSDQFEQAIEAKVTAEQNALAAKNKLDQVKYEAEQRISTAKGEAEAIRIQAQAITQQGGADYVKLQWINKWSGILPSTMLGDSTPLINLK